MQLVGTDADLGPQSKLEPVRKPRRGVHVDGGAVHLVKEALSRVIPFRNNLIGMVRPIPVDMVNRRIKRFYDFDRQNLVQITQSSSPLRLPPCTNSPPRSRAPSSSQPPFERLRHIWRKLRGDIFMHQEGYIALHTPGR